VQLAPPLIADSEQFAEIHEVLSSVLTEAWDQVVGGDAGVSRPVRPR
jgi:adenosylmethionine-8-amino-7-oxononanoate aminotransferase